MIEHRPVASLGHGDLGWLQARYHFRIGSYGNPAHQPVGGLFVWNDDEQAPGSGFPTHGHSDVEIITYVREGRILHRDSAGGAGEIAAGDVQVMSAGTGITHSETAAPDARTKLFQIWIRPRERGGEPRWDTRPFPKADRAGRFVVLASGFTEDTDALEIRADARVLGAFLTEGQAVHLDLAPGCKAYIVPTKGGIELNGVTLQPRDGAVIRDEDRVQIRALADTELVMVESV